MKKGQHIRVIVQRGKKKRLYIGTVVECVPRTLMNSETGETYPAVKARIYDEETGRLVWLPAVREKATEAA